MWSPVAREEAWPTLLLATPRPQKQRRRLSAKVLPMLPGKNTKVAMFGSCP